MSRHLFIVSRETPYLAEYMRDQFGDEPNVEIFVDRRQRERRLDQPSSPERRGRLDVARELRESFHVLVTLG